MQDSYYYRLEVNQILDYCSSISREMISDWLPCLHMVFIFALLFEQSLIAIKSVLG